MGTIVPAAFIRTSISSSGMLAQKHHVGDRAELIAAGRIGHNGHYQVPVVPVNRLARMPHESFDA